MRWSWLLLSLISFAFSTVLVAQSQESSQVNPSQHPVPHATDASGVADPCIKVGRWGNRVLLERQVAIGRSVAEQIDAHVKFVNDPVISEYVNRIGQNLARQSDAQAPVMIKVVDSDAVNALSLPGGVLYINSGLIVAADEEAELAGAIAHEIAHITACHAVRAWSSIERGPATPWAPVILKTGNIDDAGGMFGIARFTSGLEGEADYLGIEYMSRAGYDPSALVSFFAKIQTMEKSPWRPGVVAKTFESHP